MFLCTAEFFNLFFVTGQRRKSTVTTRSDDSSSAEESTNDVASAGTANDDVDVTVALQEKLSALTEEVDRYREKLALLEQEIEWLRSRSGTMEQLEKVCEVENTNIAVHSNELVRNLEQRSLSSLATAMKDGTICGGRNDFATYLVFCLTATDKE